MLTHCIIQSQKITFINISADSSEKPVLRSCQTHVVDTSCSLKKKWRSMKKQLAHFAIQTMA